MKEKIKEQFSPPQRLLIPLSLSAEEALKASKAFLGIKPKESPNIKIKVPNGLSKCEVCGEYNGTAKWKELSHRHHLAKDDDYFSVSCLCKGILCHKCNKNKIRRPISNSYYEADNCIWHNPWFTGMRCCEECREKIQREKISE